MARSGVRRGMSTGKKSPPTRPQHLDVSSGSDSSGSDSESKEIKRSRTAPSSVHVAQEVSAGPELYNCSVAAGCL